MMTKTGTILIGGVIGAAIGYVVGAVIADYVAPEYYTEEELIELSNIVDDEGYAEIGGEWEDTKPYTPSSLPTRESKGSEKKPMTQYDNFYKRDAAAKGDTSELARLAARHNADMSSDRNDDEFYDEEGDYEDFEMEGEPPYLDFTDLSAAEPTDYIDVRDTDDTYILTEDEYYANEMGYKQTLLKFYVDDDVLATEDDKPVENINIVGDYALYNFGVFTDDGNVVFVCNPHLEANYKVVKMDTSYEEAVLGAQPKKNVVIRRNIFDEEGEEDVFNH